MEVECSFLLLPSADETVEVVPRLHMTSPTEGTSAAGAAIHRPAEDVRTAEALAGALTMEAFVVPLEVADSLMVLLWCSSLLVVVVKMAAVSVDTACVLHLQEDTLAAVEGAPPGGADLRTAVGECWVVLPCGCHHVSERLLSLTC